MDIKEDNMLALRREIEEHNRAYYELDAPTITDAEYDALVVRLRAWENEHPEWVTPDSPTQRVGGRPSAAFAAVTHNVPLESLNDVFDADSVIAFDKRIREALTNEISYVVEPKVDGLSVALRYENGRFVQGATRGDGRVGEDVTHNLLTLENLPKTLKNAPDHLVVRGEVYMSREVFHQLNEQRELDGLPLLANPRNAAAGSLRQLDPKVARARRLSLVCFNIQEIDGNWPDSHFDTLDAMRGWGFPVIDGHRFEDIEQVLAAIPALGENRDSFPFDMDGAVVKVDDLSHRRLLGSTAKAPRWAVAFKYPPEEKETRVTDIVIQVGRTGVLTPKAILEPVRLAGTTVTNATLHNVDFILQKDIRISDTVLVRKAGEIIPEVLRVVLPLRPPNCVPYQFPQSCPVCGAPAVREEGEAAVRCQSDTCPAQLHRILCHFGGRDAMDIEGLGKSTVELLLAQELIASPADLYALRAEQLTGLDGFAETSANKLVRSIEASKSRDLSRLLFALGIRHVGQKAAQNLSEHFGSMKSLLEASTDDIAQVPDIGPVIAANLRAYLDLPGNRVLIDRLTAMGINMLGQRPERGSGLAGKTFVLTGTLARYTRDEAAGLIAALGGKVSSSVSKKTSYLVAGEDAGSKLTRAEGLGIHIISEEDFEAMIKE